MPAKAITPMIQRYNNPITQRYNHARRPYQKRSYIRLQDIDARLAILISVSGCSGPSTLSCVSTTLTNSSFASFDRLCFEYVNARLDMLVSVCGCSDPSTLFIVSTTPTPSSSASFHRLCFQYVNARLDILVNVSGCSDPRTLLLRKQFPRDSAAVACMGQLRCNRLGVGVRSGHLRCSRIHHDHLRCNQVRHHAWTTPNWLTLHTRRVTRFPTTTATTRLCTLLTYFAPKRNAP